MNKRIIFICIGAILFAPLVSLGAEFTRAKTFEDAWKASCRVSVSNARGTGTFIGQDKEKNRCVILTNYHVVTKNNVATLDFWTNGYRQSVSGKVYARYYDAKKPYDFALIEVDPKELAKINPPFVAPGGKGVAPDSNSYILSSGCPKGRFTQAWKGKVLGYYSGSTVEFQPAPVPGQSGSGVISVIDGELWLTAVLTWLIGAEGADTSKGGAIPIANLYDAIQGGPSNAADSNASPIPPDATECIERKPYVIEYTRDNCEPCQKALADVKEIQDSGISIVTFNSSTEIGAEKAKDKNVAAFPCFIVYTSEGVEATRYFGAEKAKLIIEDVQRLSEEETLARALKGEEELNLIVPSKEPELEDFRKRPPVYENDDDINGVGFFDDADSCWRSRNKFKASPKEQEKADDKETEKEEKRLFENRLKDKLSGSLESQMNNAITIIENHINSRIDKKIEFLKRDAKECYAKFKTKIALGLIGYSVIGCGLALLGAYGIFRFYKWCNTPDSQAYQENLPKKSKKVQKNQKTSVNATPANSTKSREMRR